MPASRTSQRCHRARRPFCVAVLLVGGMVAGCGDSGSGGVGGELPEPGVTSSAAAPTTAPVTAAPTVDSRTFTFTYAETSGLEVEATMKLAVVMPADDPDLASSWATLANNAPATSACADTPSRDGVVIGSIAFVNQSPDFEPSKLSLRFETPSFVAGSGPVLHEVHYVNAMVSCPSDLLNPAMTESHWGPVPIAFVIPNLYGPNGRDEAIFQAARDVGLRLTATDGHPSLVPGDGMEAYAGRDWWLAFDLPG